MKILLAYSCGMKQKETAACNKAFERVASVTPTLPLHCFRAPPTHERHQLRHACRVLDGAELQQSKAYVHAEGMDPLRDDALVWEEVLKDNGIPTKIDFYPVGHTLIGLSFLALISRTRL